MLGLVFIHRAVFHPFVRDWQRMIVDSICKMFPKGLATVMWKGTTDLTEKELASLGFRIVAGHDLLFRPNILKTPTTLRKMTGSRYLTWKSLLMRLNMCSRNGSGSILLSSMGRAATNWTRSEPDYRRRIRLLQCLAYVRGGHVFGAVSIYQGVR